MSLGTQSQECVRPNSIRAPKKIFDPQHFIHWPPPSVAVNPLFLHSSPFCSSTFPAEAKMTNERMARSMRVVDTCALTHSHLLTFRDKLKGAAEYSEAWQSFCWPIVQELMAQAVATPAATNLGCINQDTSDINSHKCTIPQHTKPSLPACDCTFTGPQASGSLLTLSSWMVLEKAGQGEECSNLDVLENNSCPHSEHTYIPERTKVKPTTSDTCYPKLWDLVLFSTTHRLQSDFYILLHQRKSNMTFRPFKMYSYNLQPNDFRV